MGVWLFALGVAIAHACGLDGASDQQPLAEQEPLPLLDDNALRACCGEDTLAVKLQPLVNAPGGQPLAPLAFVDPLLGGSSPPILQRSNSVHRAIDVPLSIRFARLTL
jgi:hypothetical protein